ncbi:hypothetical protein XM38_043150 [Halomicronema hongdechloris C2206]|uniref:DUF2721 domain-containing protein n=1 Tax=Halomicronema hongdechloris C2206 TaxID=1641165 RepID=A0A1Z3HSQ8_9CYAN|nr:hypothetical protein [Halomicronema hongdechloris]ASC73350.1 hypothetical protein XM38_043150 [Halomicronema hongdechloris C2206]
MSVHQTSQLIQLMLNSALMTLLAALFWLVLWLHHGSLATQLQHRLQRRRSYLARGPWLGEQPGQWLQASRRPSQLLLAYRLIGYSIGVLHGVLTLFLASLLGLALRTLVSLDGLIVFSLALFTLGIAGMLLAAALALGSLYQRPSHRHRRRSPAPGQSSAAQESTPSQGIAS